MLLSRIVFLFFASRAQLLVTQCRGAVFSTSSRQSCEAGCQLRVPSYFDGARKKSEKGSRVIEKNLSYCCRIFFENAGCPCVALHTLKKAYDDVLSTLSTPRISTAVSRWCTVSSTSCLHNALPLIIVEHEKPRLQNSYEKMLISCSRVTTLAVFWCRSTTVAVCGLHVHANKLHFQSFFPVAAVPDIRIRCKSASTITTSAVPTFFSPHKSRHSKAKSCHTCAHMLPHQPYSKKTRNVQQEVKFDSMINSRQSMAKNERINKLHTKNVQH